MTLPVACPEDDRFEGVFAAFDAAGGIAQSEEVGQLLEETRNGDRMSLFRAMSRGEVLSIAWLDVRWIPLFQLAPHDLSVWPEVASVLVELQGVYNDLEIGCWFTEPNGWLDSRRPMDVLRFLPRHVAQAARADRYIATS